ncbi:MAG: carbamoyltransferase HypF, partial [Acidimicrobiales bacterium]
VEGYPSHLAWEGGQLVIDPRPLIAALLEAKAGGVPVEVQAAAFHEGFAAAAVAAATLAARVNDVDTVALSGGVFQNSRLSILVAQGLRQAGLQVLQHRLVPPNDGGISVGQAAIAAFADSAPIVEQAV